MTRYRHTKDMEEIGGFDRAYEEACQDMLEAGVEWISKNPDKSPRFKGFKGVTGLYVEDNEAAKELSAVLLEAAGGDMTGAMHQTVASRVLWIRKNGWDAYCEEMRKRLTDA